ncbi:DNA-binding transcriptional regulator, GntR family [Brevibacterium sp. Mu109]|uniref:GntR family transcriptional regulator n=1 Tax=Brevibacterium sp. Mu109 TaxID=1255669 RepID=UPI000C5B8DF2|nr:GntR family transcriptional regulator [Brevibacterium sp. Mu109]SMX88941.1 DNA-binding transcriptional regulator, GntR family [Brevibacterium sp. Mu109]
MTAGALTGDSLIESPSLAELAAGRISELVFRGELRPDERLVEEHLCERLGVSRAPVREGLRILEGSGLVVRRPRAGVRVAGLTQNDVFEILTFREGLERMAVEHLYRYTDDVTTVDTSRLDAALAQLAHEFEDGENQYGRIQASYEFHTELVRLCGNARIIASYTQITMQVKLCMSLNLRKLAAEETPAENVTRHRDLRAAVLSGDLTEALRAIDEHGHDSFAHEFLEGLPGATENSARWLARRSRTPV